MTRSNVARRSRERANGRAKSNPIARALGARHKPRIVQSKKAYKRKDRTLSKRYPQE